MRFIVVYLYQLIGNLFHKHFLTANNVDAAASDDLIDECRCGAFGAIAADHRVVDCKGLPSAVVDHATAKAIRSVAVDRAVCNRPIRDRQDLYAATGNASCVLGDGKAAEQHLGVIK